MHLNSNEIWFKRNNSQGICFRRQNHNWTVLFRSDGMIITKNSAGQTVCSQKQELVSVAWHCTRAHCINCSEISFTKMGYWDQLTPSFYSPCLARADFFCLSEVRNEDGMEVISYHPKHPEECDWPYGGDNFRGIWRMLSVVEREL